MKKLLSIILFLALASQVKSQDLAKGLHEAILSTNLENVKKVVEEFKADVNEAYDNKALGSPTPLNVSCFIANVEITEYLLSKGADPMKENKFGTTALGSLAENAAVDEKSEANRILIYDMLIQKNIDVNKNDKAGVCALGRAAYWGHAGLVKKMLEHKELEIDNRKNAFAKTALMLAAERGNLEIVKMLHEAGADPNEEVKIATRAGTFDIFKASDLAKNKNHAEVYEYLKSAKKIKKKK